MPHLIFIRPLSVILIVFAGVLMLHFYSADIINYTNSIDGTLLHGGDSQFSIYTEGCHIPDYDPFDNRVQSFLANASFVCPSFDGDGLTYIENHTLIVNTTVLATFGVHSQNASAENFTCCMWHMYRHEVEDEDNILRFPEKCVSFENSIAVSDEYLKVECYLNGRRIHETFHVNHVRKPEVESRCEKATVWPKCLSEDRFSVIVLFLDSVSRLNFRRHFPESRRVLLDDLDAIELNGYNRVGDNTFPNFIPLIAGMTSDQLRSTCWPNEESYFDNCSFIWQDFADIGYRTAFVEDFPDIGAFHFQKRGFQKQPTDYYAHSFLKEAYKLMYMQKDCINGLSESENILLWAYNFMKHFRNDPTFGIFSTSRFTHDNINTQKVVDPILAKYLKMIKAERLNEKSFIIVMADHGIRFGDYRKSTLGSYEVNLPVCYIVPPPNFSANHSKAHEHLRENSNQLTTPFDLYETFLDIVKCDYGGEPKDGVDCRNQKQPSSLFRPISKSRTCSMAGIPKLYCACANSNTDLDVNSNISRRVSEVLIEGVNHWTEPYRNMCAKFEIQSVLKVQLLESKGGPHDGEQHYDAMVEVTPGNAVFEGLVTEKNDNSTTDRLMTYDPDITRIDYYGSSSNCVRHAVLRKYCYCV